MPSCIGKFCALFFSRSAWLRERSSLWLTIITNRAYNWREEMTQWRKPLTFSCEPLEIRPSAVKASTQDVPGRLVSRGTTIGHVLAQSLTASKALNLATTITASVASNARAAGVAAHQAEAGCHHPALEPSPLDSFQKSLASRFLIDGTLVMMGEPRSLLCPERAVRYDGTPPDSCDVETCAEWLAGRLPQRRRARRDELLGQAGCVPTTHVRPCRQLRRATVRALRRHTVQPGDQDCEALTGRRGFSSPICLIRSTCRWFEQELLPAFDARELLTELAVPTDDFYRQAAAPER